MVNVEVLLASTIRLCAAANRTAATLLSKHPVVVGMGDPIGPTQLAVPVLFKRDACASRVLVVVHGLASLRVAPHPFRSLLNDLRIPGPLHLGGQACPASPSRGVDLGHPLWVGAVFRIAPQATETIALAATEEPAIPAVAIVDPNLQAPMLFAARHQR